jgi:hypothetical protein
LDETLARVWWNGLGQESLPADRKNNAIENARSVLTTGRNRGLLTIVVNVGWRVGFPGSPETQYYSPLQGAKGENKGVVGTWEVDVATRVPCIADARLFLPSDMTSWLQSAATIAAFAGHISDRRSLHFDQPTGISVLCGQSAETRGIKPMTAHLQLLSPSNENRSVRTRRQLPKRPGNRDLRPREYLTPTEVETLIRTARKGRHGHRDATLILIAYRHGLRAIELCDLEWSQVEFSRSASLQVQRAKNGNRRERACRSPLAPTINKLNAALPAGYHIVAGGTVEESSQSQASVFAKVPLMLFLMLLFLMAQLHSFSRLALVLCVIPMGLIGIVGALLIAGRPLGFVAILGILALMGMIARNAVILIEQIETERAQGRDAWGAVVEGSVSRFRPIMLTAISTVLGFIPIAPTVFWGPMAFAIMGGLFVATILTLIVLPALYVVFFRLREPPTMQPKGAANKAFA